MSTATIPEEGIVVSSLPEEVRQLIIPYIFERVEFEIRLLHLENHQRLTIFKRMAIPKKPIGIRGGYIG